MSHEQAQNINPGQLVHALEWPNNTKMLGVVTANHGFPRGRIEIVWIPSKVDESWYHCYYSIDSHVLNTIHLVND